MPELSSFFIVLLTALVFSQIFRRLHVPWVIALIVGGMAVGPFGLGIMTPDPTLEFLKNLGLVFLMFMAGLEVRFTGMRLVWKESLMVAAFAGGIPFLAGLAIGILFGYSVSVTILIGVVLISSSIAVLIPSLEAKGLFHSRLGRTIVSSVVVQDIASLVLLAAVLQYFFSTSPLPFPIFIAVFALILPVVGAIKLLIPRLKKLFSEARDLFERDLRIVFVVLVGIVLISEAMGLHSIIGAFLAGIVLSESITGSALKEKIHILAYGLFIPVFFVVLGAQTDYTAVFRGDTAAVLLVAVLSGSIFSKILGGWISGRLAGFTSIQSLFIGTNSIPQLSTTLAVVTVAQNLGIFGSELVTTLIFLSIVTTFVGPLLSRIIFNRMKKKYFVFQE